MSIRFYDESRRVKSLRALHGDDCREVSPISRESLSFLFKYVETLESEILRSTDIRFCDSDPVRSLAERDPYYMARATAGPEHFYERPPAGSADGKNRLSLSRWDNEGGAGPDGPQEGSHRRT